MSRRRPKKSLGVSSKRAKRKRGVGKMNFCPPAFRRRRNRGESVSAIPASAGKQNRKIFVSLIEKKFGGRRLKKCRENFFVLLAETKRRRAETLSRIQSAKFSGFSSKKVRILTKRHRTWAEKHVAIKYSL